MPLSKKISEALAKKALNGGPCNIFEMPEKDLQVLGYRVINVEKSILQSGDILSLSKGGTLWLALESVQNFRKTLKEPADKISGPIYRK